MDLKDIEQVMKFCDGQIVKYEQYLREKAEKVAIA
jgi:hypothetical protein